MSQVLRAAGRFAFEMEAYTPGVAPDLEYNSPPFAFLIVFPFAIDKSKLGSILHIRPVSTSQCYLFDAPMIAGIDLMCKLKF